MSTATLTKTGQITFPLEVREGMGIKPGDQVDFEPLSDGVFMVRPSVDPSPQSPERTAMLIRQFITAGKLVPAKNRTKGRKFGSISSTVDLNDLLDAERG